MSRTDAHRPGWVQLFDSSLPVYVDHDHRHGECIEDTVESARFYHGSRFSRHNCPRRVWETYFCPEGEGGKCEVYWYPVWDYHDNVTYKARQCEGHLTSHIDKGLKCTYCETAPPVATCDRTFARGYLYWRRLYGGGGVPREFIQGEWSNPERRRVRDELGAVKKLYNAGEDLEGYDFPNFQHRHGAGWHFW